LFAVFVGAGLGAWLRWWFSMVLNPLFPTIPMGTVAANLVGGFLVGLAGGYFSHNASVAPEWRLLIITGFMGGLTTFSTFSLEVVNLVGRQQYGWALAQIGLHLLGSLALTALGILAAQALFARF
jgi:CrcB protein